MMKKYLLIIFALLLMVGPADSGMLLDEIVSGSTGPEFVAYNYYESWEADPGSDIAKTATTLTVSNCEKNAIAYLRYSHGTGSIGEFKFRFTGNVTTAPTDSIFTFWSVTNEGAPTYDQMNTEDDGISVYYLNGQIGLKDQVESSSDYYASATTGTDYYMEVERTDSATTLKIYSDSGFTTLLDTLSVTYNSTPYEYVVGFANKGSTGTELMTGTVGSLQEWKTPDTFASYTPTAGVIDQSSTNGRYLINAVGDEMLVSGSASFFWTISGQKVPNKQRVDDFVDWLVANGHNFTRAWTGYHYLEAEMPGMTFPWNRSTGTAFDGLGDFDLTTINSDYIDLTRYFLQQCEANNIYVSFLLFGSSNRMATAAIDETAWHPDNNVNAGTSGISVEDDFYDTTDSSLMALQEGYIENMIDELGDFGNIVWELINEPTYTATAKTWSEHITDHIVAYEAGKAKQHLVLFGGDASGNGDFLTTSIRNNLFSPDLSNSSSEYKDEGGPATYNSKIVINDTDHLWGYSVPGTADAYRSWVWMTALRGNNPVFMDDYDSFLNSNGGEINSAYAPVRNALGFVQEVFADFSDLGDVTPSESLSSTTFYIADAGLILVYDPDGAATFTIYLAVGEYDITWVDPQDESTSADTITVSSAGDKTFTTPGHIADDSLVWVEYTGVPSGTTKYVGYTTSEPSSSPSNTGATISGDRTLCKEWTATEDGTMNSVWFYRGVGDWPFPNDWVTVWKKNGTDWDLVDSAVITTPTQNDWNEVSLGSDITFSTNDVLRFGITVNHTGTNGYYGRDDGVGTSYYDSTTSITTSIPDPIADTNFSASSNNYGFVLEYTN